MIARETIKKIIEAGVQAPSGDNSQPWKFKIDGDDILVLSTPEKDNPIFNFRGRGTLIAHGALTENICIAASFFGCEARVSLFPDAADPKVTAKISLSEKEQEKDPLYDAIWKRATNRKAYENRPLSGEHRMMIAESARNGEGKISLIEDRGKINTVGSAVSVNEIVMLENRTLHDYFFADVRWTEKDEREKKSGLYAKTMELTPPQKAVFKIMSFWPAAKALSAVGMSKFIASENSKIYSSGSAIGIITVPDDDKEFFAAGRLTERIWLRAVSAGLSMHLITGVLYLMQGVSAGQSALSDKHASLVKEAYGRIRESFGVDDGVIAMLFRIGDGGEPSGRSSRLEPVILD